MGAWGALSCYTAGMTALDRDLDMRAAYRLGLSISEIATAVGLTKLRVEGVVQYRTYQRVKDGPVPPLPTTSPQ